MKWSGRSLKVSLLGHGLHILSDHPFRDGQMLTCLTVFPKRGTRIAKIHREPRVTVGHEFKGSPVELKQCVDEGTRNSRVHWSTQGLQ